MYIYITLADAIQIKPSTNAAAISSKISHLRRNARETSGGSGITSLARRFAF